MVNYNKYLYDPAIEKMIEDLVPSIVQSTISIISQKTAVKSSVDSLKPLSDLCDDITQNMGLKVAEWVEQKTDNLVVPDGTKFFCENDDEYVLIVEQKPQVRTVGFSQDFIRKYSGSPIPKTTYKLAFPYIVFIFTVSYKSEVTKIQVAYRTASLQSLNDDLYYANLPNIIDESMCVCMGNELPRGRNLCNAVNKAITEFWARSFNTDATFAFEEHSPIIHKQRITLESWERETKNNPLFVLKNIWNKASPVKKYVSSQPSLLKLPSILFQQMIDSHVGRIKNSIVQCFDEIENTQINGEKLIRNRIGFVLSSLCSVIQDDIYKEQIEHQIRMLKTQQDTLKKAQLAAENARKKYENLCLAGNTKKEAGNTKKELYGANDGANDEANGSDSAAN